MRWRHFSTLQERFWVDPHHRVLIAVQQKDWQVQVLRMVPGLPLPREQTGPVAERRMAVVLPALVLEQRKA